MAGQGPWEDPVSLWVFSPPYLMGAWKLSKLLSVEVVWGAQEIVEVKWGGEQLSDVGSSVLALLRFQDPNNSLSVENILQGHQ